MSTIPLVTLPPLGPFYGSFYFGTIMSMAFYGVACMQTYFYYVHYQNDPLQMKIFIAVLWGINTVHEALSVSGTYKYIMHGLLSPLSYIDGSPDLVLQLFFTCLAGLASQGFFVYRIYVFSRKNAVAPFIWVPLAILQFVSAAMYVGKGLYSVNGVTIQNVPITVLNEKPFTTLGTLYLSVAAGVDIFIAFIMTFLLLRQRAATDHTTMAHILQRLIVFSVNTGIWTATFALLTIIFLYVFPGNVLYAVPCAPICEVYCNTLLANLNARMYIRCKDMTVIVDREFE